jgi:effector-binding domain-containing protein
MVDSISYTILKKSNNFEIRQYPPLVVASTTSEKGTTAFNLLFNYISGNNKSREKISMTAPVFSSEKIPMTSPVISKGNYMAFSLPSTYSLDTAPSPINPRVNIEFIPKRTLAIIRFSGKTNEARINKYSQKLKGRVKIEQLSTKGPIILLRYNSPFTPGFLRRNEVAIELIHFKVK